MILNRNCACIVVAALGWVSAVEAQQSVPATPSATPHSAVLLWANGAPGSEGKTAPELVTDAGEGEHRVSSINAPSIAPYLVRNAKTPTAAVIIAPGGGHQFLSIEMEGYDVAKYLAGHGVAAFVLKYRLAREKGSTYTVEGDELNDMQRAIRLVRANAAEWNVDPDRVGVMGFSAGGELAVLAATRFHTPAGLSRDVVDRESDKPAFEALMYPGGLTAPAPVPAGAANAAGAPFSGPGGLESIPPVTLKPELLANMGKMAPAFMLCGADDRPAIGQALPQLFVAMKRAGVSAELHEYAGVGHGFGLRFSQKGPVAEWPALFVDWLDTKGFLRK